MNSPLRKDRLISLAARVEGVLAFNKVNLGRSSSDSLGYPCGSLSLGKTTTYYPTLWIEPQEQELTLPDSGKAIIEYNVKRRTVTETDGKKRYEASIEVRSIEPMDGKAKKSKPPGAAKPMKFAVRPRRVFAFKTRNAMGEFAPNDGGVVDESMMAKAYGAPSAVRRNLVGGGGKAGLAVASGGKATAARLVGRSGTRLPVIRRAATRLMA